MLDSQNSLCLNVSFINLFWQIFTCIKFDSFSLSSLDTQIHFVESDLIKIQYSFQSEIGFVCPIDYKKFPFQKPVCEMKISSNVEFNNTLVYKVKIKAEMCFSVLYLPRSLLIWAAFQLLFFLFLGNWRIKTRSCAEQSQDKRIWHWCSIFGKDRAIMEFWRWILLCTGLGNQIVQLVPKTHLHLFCSNLHVYTYILGIFSPTSNILPCQVSWIF